MKCKTCGKNADSEYCFRHKPRTALTKKSSLLHKKIDKSEEELEQISELHAFFNKTWKKKMHYSEISMDYLGKEPMSTYFHHILPKEKYPEAMLDEENIILLTLEEHDNVERDMYKYRSRSARAGSRSAPSPSWLRS